MSTSYSITFNLQEGYVNEVVTLPLGKVLPFEEFVSWKNELSIPTVEDLVTDWATEIKDALRMRLDALRKMRILAQLQETPIVLSEMGDGFVLRQSNDVWVQAGPNIEAALVSAIEKIKTLEVEKWLPIFSPAERKQLCLSVSYPNAINLENDEDHRYRWSDVLNVLIS